MSWTYHTPPQDDPPVTCDFCGDVIEEGDKCVRVESSAIQRGEKSGRLMALPEVGQEATSYVVHGHCHLELALEQTGMGPDELLQLICGDTEVYCAGCEAKLSGR